MNSFTWRGVLWGVLLMSQSGLSAHELTGLGAVGGWDDVNKSSSISTVLDRSDYSQDMSSARVESSLLSAYGTWGSISSAPNLNFSFLPDLGGNYDVFDMPGGSLDQGAHFRYANTVMGGWMPESYFTSLDANGANILGVTWSARLRGDGSGKPTWHTEILFNDGWLWTDDAAAANADFALGLPEGIIDLETVALHEIGHSIGIGHENDVPSVMASFYDGVQRDLFLDDIDVASFLYSNALDDGKKGGGKGNGKGKPFSLDGMDWFLAGVTWASGPDDGTVHSIAAGGDSAAVPEPGTYLTLGSCLLLLVLLRRRTAIDALQ